MNKKILRFTKILRDRDEKHICRAAVDLSYATGFDLNCYKWACYLGKKLYAQRT